MPQELEQQLMQFQQIQKQAQTIAQQRLQFEIQLKETEKTLNELEGLGESPDIYKSVGTFLIKSKKEPLTKELKERKETLAIRIKSYKSQEDKVTEKLKSMKTDIEKQLKGFTPTAG